MSAKSSSGCLGTLVLVALTSWHFIDRMRKEARLDEIRRGSRSSLSHSSWSSSRDSIAKEKARLDSMREALERGDSAGVLAVYTNLPSGASIEQRKSVKAYADLIQRIDTFVAEFDARAATEGLDFDLMLSPRFVCGLDGFETSLRRVDKAIDFINEREEKIKEFLKEKDSLSSWKIDGANSFDLTAQWKRVRDAMKTSFDLSRQMAAKIRELVLLHRDHPQEWKVEDGEVLYYDADFCDQVNDIRAKLLTLAGQQLRQENMVSETQKETFDKIGKAFDKPVSRSIPVLPKIEIPPSLQFHFRK